MEDTESGKILIMVGAVPGTEDRNSVSIPGAKKTMLSKASFLLEEVDIF